MSIMPGREELLAGFEEALARYRAYRAGLPAGRLARALVKLRLGGVRYAALSALRLLRAETMSARLFCGGKFTAGVDEYGDAMYVFGLLWYEPEIRLTRFLLGHLAPGDRFVDVGANYGYYSMLAAEASPGGGVLAFEPSPRVYPFLKANLAPYPRAEALQLAASDRAGKAEFYEGAPAYSCQSTLCAEGAAGAGPARFSKTTAEEASLDAVCAARGFRPSWLKVDAEGWEDKVLAGAADTLAACRPAVVMEVWTEPQPQHRRAWEFLAGLGYKSYRISEGGGAEPCSSPGTPAGGAGWDNYVFRV